MYGVEAMCCKYKTKKGGLKYKKTETILPIYEIQNIKLIQIITYVLQG